jgi:histone acetyltransferase
MPKEYIARLVFDKSHCSMAVVKQPYTVLGGITFRPFVSGEFAEIVFCAIDTSCQVQGYGSRLMSHVKDYVRTAYNCKYFLTYADNYAIGYFKKQGFTTDITLDRAIWMGYIKDYEGGTIMQCTMIEKVKYLDYVSIIAAQRWAVFKKISDHTNSKKVYPGIKWKAGKTLLDPSEIPGLQEAGWIPNATHLAHRPTPRQRGPLYIFMKKILTEMHENTHSWPFVEPVAGVADYYEVIKNPMGILI